MSETPNRGTTRDALAITAFRRLYIGSFLSGIGRWMQMATLGVLAWEISNSSKYLGAVIFANLGPLAFLSLLGGSLADTGNRRKVLFLTQIWQLAWTIVLAINVADGEIGQRTLLVIVFTIGLGQGIYAPTFTSVIPELAGRNNLQAAVALNSMSMNGARVIGPALGGWLTSRFGFAEVFGLNAATYLFVLVAIALTQIPSTTAEPKNLSDRLLGGFKIAKRAPQIGRPLALMSLFSFFCLPFIGQLPAIAEINLGIDAKSTQFGWFYATFGFGALFGALLVGTVLLQARRDLLIKFSLISFGATLAWLVSLRSINFGYLAIFLVGLCYLILPTTLSTYWQEHVDENIRGRIAAIWVLSFGGTVPFGNLIAGPVIEMTSLSAVLYTSAIIAVLLGAFFRLKPGPVIGEGILYER
ncbi:MAG: MFS transporter [Acidimicrobiales bacterium]|jgi:MFS family permease|nr:MFS transporter [Acidimicrobiales bacterium]